MTPEISQRQIRLIRVVARSAVLELERRMQHPDPDRLRVEAAQVAYVLRDEDGELVCRTAAWVLDRGRKHPAKPLAPLLLGHDRIPLIRGGYTSPGQLLRSLRMLLTHAQRRGERNAYLVTAGERLFDVIWRRARAAPTTDIERGAERSTLLELLPELPLPPAVEEKYIGTSADARLVRQLTLRAAQRHDPVLILGDTGTGKEVVARLIHDVSPRRLQAFIAVNCGAIPRELFESELFGYESGSHSMARERKIGLWRLADRGSLFLDEIGDLALDHQAKILRVLETGEIWPVGATKPVKVDARVLAATNRDLYAMVQSGDYREDLYYRLRSFLIRTPALRDHPVDIPLLAHQFWVKITGDPEARLPTTILDELRAYRWPGNARELRTVLSNLFGLFGADDLDARHLRAVFEFEGQARQGMPAPGAAEASELAGHRVACLRHLRRVDEVIHACEVAASPVVTEAKVDPATVAAARDALGRHLDELDLLCGRRLLFHEESVHAAAARLLAGLRSLHRALGQEPGTGLAVWRAEVERSLDAASRGLFEEVRQLVRSP